MKIEIGEITISIMNNGHYWLEASNGEGCEVTKAMLTYEMQQVFRKLM